MNKNDMKKLAVLGLMGGLLIGTQGNASEKEENNLKLDNKETFFAAAGCGSHCGNHGSKPTASRDNFVTDETNTKAITENDLFSQITPESKAIYINLDAEGKRLALELAATSSDKNEAVKAAKKLADKRIQPK